MLTDRPPTQSGSVALKVKYIYLIFLEYFQVFALKAKKTSIHITNLLVDLDFQLYFPDVQENFAIIIMLNSIYSLNLYIYISPNAGLVHMQ